MAQQINYRFNKIQPKSDMLQFIRKNEKKTNTTLINTPKDES